MREKIEVKQKCQASTRFKRLLIDGIRQRQHINIMFSLSSRKNSVSGHILYENEAIDMLYREENRSQTEVSGQHQIRETAIGYTTSPAYKYYF